MLREGGVQTRLRDSGVLVMLREGRVQNGLSRDRVHMMSGSAESRMG